MRIAVIGATGMVGSCAVAEARRRGHTVTAVARSRKGAAVLPRSTRFVIGDALDLDAMTKLFARHDVAIVATRPAPGAESVAVTTTRTVLDAALTADRPIVIVGGAGPLRVTGAAGLVIDNPRYVPPEWRAIAQASVDQLRECESHGADWRYLSPPALLEPGQRTGTYRRGTTHLLTDADGDSRISAEDLAVVLLDEVERPGPPGTMFTAAY